MFLLRYRGRRVERYTEADFILRPFLQSHLHWTALTMISFLLDASISMYLR